MRITLKLYASLSDYLPEDARRTNEWVMDVPDRSTVAALIEKHQLPDRLVHLVLVNGHYIAPVDRGTHVLVDGDALAIWPPVAGG